MVSLENVLMKTIWVGKFYEGGRISGTYAEVSRYNDELRDLDIACLENQPEHLKEFYEGYFNQSKYYDIREYYNNVYNPSNVTNMYEVSYIKDGIGHANVYLAKDELAITAHFLEKRADCELVGIRHTTYAKPGQPIINLTRGGN